MMIITAYDSRPFELPREYTIFPARDKCYELANRYFAKQWILILSQNALERFSSIPVSCELRLTRVARARREYRFNLLKIEFAGCSLSLISATFIFHDWEKMEKSQRRLIQPAVMSG